MIRKKPIDPEAAKLKMASLCAKAEHCEYEIKEKLRKMGIATSDIREIVEFLISNRFIDNYRFASSYANDKVKFSGWGRNKIKQGLFLKRIPQDAISAACAEIDDNEYLETLAKSARYKAKSLDLKEYDDRTRLYRYLASRGFESSLITGIIRQLINGQKQ